MEAELTPANASQVFGDRLKLAEKYADLLARDGDLLGLIGPRELPKLWSRHILNSAVVADLVEVGEVVADIGVIETVVAGRNAHIGQNRVHGSVGERERTELIKSEPLEGGQVIVVAAELHVMRTERNAETVIDLVARIVLHGG